MKKYLTVVAAALMSAAVLQAQDFKFKPYMEEFQEGEKVTSVQGAAVFGDLFFQFQDGNKEMKVYNLAEKTLVDAVALNPVKRWHNNNVKFSDTYYKAGDEFPLLYASQENAQEHCIAVWRITRSGDKFAAEIVQMITLPSPVEMGVWYPNQILDVKGGRLFVTGYSAPSWNRPDNGNNLQLLCFAIPEFRKGKDVTLSTSDIITRTTSTFRVATQGAAVRNGKIYQVYGVPTWGADYIVCRDATTGKVEWERYLAELGFRDEPEGLDFWHDEIVVVNNRGTIFRSGLIIPEE